MTLPANSPKKALLKLPHLAWEDERGWYPFLLIVPTKDLHDSGWRHIAIIGGDYDEQHHPIAKNIIATPDDLHLPSVLGDYPPFRFDAFGETGVLRLWSPQYDFSVDRPLSSTTVLVRPSKLGK